MPDTENPAGFPACSIDVVVLTLKDGRLHAALQRRQEEPFLGSLCLIGGIVRMDADSDLDAAVARVLREKAGLSGIYAEQLYTFGDAARDPRGWTVAVAYIALVPFESLSGARTDALEFVPADEAAGLAFDHDRILGVALGRLRGKGAYSVLPARFLGGEFSLPEMQRTYEQVLGTRTSLAAFKRKVMEVGIVEPTGGRRIVPGSTRPSAMYRLASDADTFDRRL